jgi:starch phosphorylase
MEYGLDSSFKIYSGGLGILAGDYLKGAKDNNMPVVGIGIKWKQGYVEQRIDEEGNIYDCFRNYNYDFLEDTGIKIRVKIRQSNVYCKVWKVDCFGNADLYLLDTNIKENSDRWITGRLYGGGVEERIAQEIVLGIGGVRALRALNIPVDTYHFNEGHAVFAGIELMNEKMNAGMSFDKAWKSTRKEVVFTTHTPIKAGNESHGIEALTYIGANLGFSVEQMSRIGGIPFNMTVAALRLSRRSNAVSELHTQTANRMWAKIKNRSKINALLIGFSRRAASYKRSDLIFKDEKRIEKYLKDGKVQIIFSGKAHPLDTMGKKVVLNLVEMSRKYPNSVVFMENYDMEIGQILTRGCDVWLNNPRRPNEASGTSGMKAVMNGVLNCSILDGWWPEACKDGINGWAIGDENIPETVEEQDEKDAKALYYTLLERVIPTYYNHHQKWLEMMKESIESTKTFFSVDRMINDYYKLLYQK